MTAQAFDLVRRLFEIPGVTVGCYRLLLTRYFSAFTQIGWESFGLGRSLARIERVTDKSLRIRIDNHPVPDGHDASNDVCFVCHDDIPTTMMMAAIAPQPPSS